MRILVAPDKFKGSLSAAQAAEAMAAGVARVDPSIQTQLCPLADGGEGTLEILVKACGGSIVQVPISGPVGGIKLEGPMGFSPDGQVAFIEIASCCGLEQIPIEQRDPMRTGSFGAGQLLRHAIQRGAKTVIVALGGSGTVDGGIGLLQGFGAHVLLDNGTVYSGHRGRKLRGADVGHVMAVSASAAGAMALWGGEHAASRRAGGGVKALPALAEKLDLSGRVKIIGACDVDNPLLGERGAARVFGPQKGATADVVEYLDRALGTLAERLGAAEAAQAPGSGAAGGIGFILRACFGATLRAGVDMVMEQTDFAAKLRQCDLCLTGEGLLEAQSLGGKTVVGVARACQAAGKPCIALAGGVALDGEVAQRHGISAMRGICAVPASLEQAKAHAARWLGEATEQTVRMLQIGVNLSALQSRP